MPLPRAAAETTGGASPSPTFMLPHPWEARRARFRRRKLRIVRSRVSARACSLRYSSSPLRKHFAGLRNGFGRGNVHRAAHQRLPLEGKLSPKAPDEGVINRRNSRDARRGGACPSREPPRRRREGQAPPLHLCQRAMRAPPSSVIRLPPVGMILETAKPGAEKLRAGLILSGYHSIGLPYIASNSVQSASAAFGTSIPTSQPAMSSVPTSGSFILSA